MYYFDFIKKIEIPVDYELTWDFVSERLATNDIKST
jgi:hypothetical protein